jgi:hypothetical protein
MYKFPFSLPPFYTAIVRCLGVLEGLAIEVDGRFKIINGAYPYIAGRVLTDPQLQVLLPSRALLSSRFLVGALSSTARLSAGLAGVHGDDEAEPRALGPARGAAAVGVVGRGLGASTGHQSLRRLSLQARKRPPPL